MDLSGCSLRFTRQQISRNVPWEEWAAMACGSRRGHHHSPNVARDETQATYFNQGLGICFRTVMTCPMVVSMTRGCDLIPTRTSIRHPVPPSPLSTVRRIKCKLIILESSKQQKTLCSAPVAVPNDSLSVVARVSTVPFSAGSSSKH
jgi:hypothetical protein